MPYPIIRLIRKSNRIVDFYLKIDRPFKTWNLNSTKYYYVDCVIYRWFCVTVS